MNTEKNHHACLAFSYCGQIGPVVFLKLLEVFKTPYNAFSAPNKELARLFPQKLLASFIEFRKKFNIHQTLHDLQNNNICYIAYSDLEYPVLLKNISDPPIGLFYRGNWKRIQECKFFLGVVGTRKATGYGKNMTRLLVSPLAREGVCIVSGMALGIDAEAHEICLETGGATIAVLGCGVDIIYPPSHRKLYEKICKNGVVLSEFVPGTMVHRGLFVARNRIISGLSQGTLVVEGGKRSGTLITARCAAEQGRDLFAVPGAVGITNSEAPLLLLKQGAVMVTEAEDILSYWGVDATPLIGKTAIPLNPQQQKVMGFLRAEPFLVDELSQEMGLDIILVGQELSTLELLGVVAQNEEGRWFVR